MSGARKVFKSCYSFCGDVRLYHTTTKRNQNPRYEKSTPEQQGPMRLRGDPNA